MENLILAGAAVVTAYAVGKVVQYGMQNSGPSSSSSSSSNKNEQTKHQEKTECYTLKDKKSCGIQSNKQCYASVTINNTEEKFPLKIITCKDGSVKEYYYVDADTKNVLTEKHRGYFIDETGPDTPLGNDYTEAMKTLIQSCGCK